MITLINEFRKIFENNLYSGSENSITRFMRNMTSDISVHVNRLTDTIIEINPKAFIIEPSLQGQDGMLDFFGLKKIHPDLNKKTNKNIFSNHNLIPGGLSDHKTIKDIAKKYDVSEDVVLSKLKKGIKVELEHTSDQKIATEIAMDHLMEMLDYYDKLETIEENDNSDMINGIIDLLKQVKDIENRKEMANKQLFNFKKEKINIDDKKFLKDCELE